MFKKSNLIKLLVALVIVALSLVLIYFVSTEDTTSAGSASTTLNSPYLQQNNAIKVESSGYYDGSKIFKLPDTVKGTDTISVIVQNESEALYDAYTSAKLDISFQEYLKSEDAEKVRKSISNENARIKDMLTLNGASYTVGASYDTVLSGFEIIIKASDFEQIAKSLEGIATTIVSEVYNPAETTLVENKVNVYETGIFDSSDFKYDGTGMTVAVLDTGLDYTHTAFKNFNVPKDKLGLDFDDITKLLQANDFLAESLQSGLTASDVYINDKVPFAFDYADGDSDVFPINSDHGTHVAGIIAGKDDRITGVAPNAQLVIMKTFSDTESSARATWILSALEDCVTLDVDVINMSLGTDCGFSRPIDKEAMSGIYDKIKDSGISLVVAASNSYNSTYGSEKNGNLGLTSNPDSATVGSPSTYDAAFSIASISGVKTPYLLFGDTIIYYSESSDRVSEEKDFLKDVLGENKTEAEIELVVVPGVGRVADYTGMDVTGKIVLVRRGDSTFEEKANVAQSKGAAGIIVYNNVSGDIKMNVGEATLGAVSISQADGEYLASQGGGIIKVSTSQTSGPFMSDFSSWGPTPSLGIKPELTAHGGSILSAVPGQDYDRISGTSMATPNTSGVVILLRQYVKENFPSIADDDKKVAALVNCLLMSTADIVYNKNGLPYSIRKQGAGLGNLISAAETTAYIVTYDKSGNEMDKTKFELGDDPDKTGIYTLSFDIKNFGNTALTYDLSMIVMTEGVSDTKTSHGETTVTEAGYMLSPVIKIVSVTNGTQSEDKITVNANTSAKVKVEIELSAEDKKYLDDSFKNGMYVEGFLVLENTNEAGVDLSAPFLAFYGDWTKAPILDLDYYETNKDELDAGIDFEDKKLPDAYATRPIGSVEDDYVNYMGSFYFTQDPSETPIAADRKYVSISNQVGSVHSLEYVWAGLLRNCAKVHIVITDDATGEVVHDVWDENVRKSYSNGQTIFPANIEVGFDAMEKNLKNNTKYTVTLTTYLDYENDGLETNENNTFTFPVVTDFEAPAVTGVEYYTEYDKSTKKTRLFAKIAVYDNHYAMGMQIGYVGIVNNELILDSFDQYVKAIYSEFNTTNYVTYELTDYIEQIKENAYNKNTFTVAVYDYALNQATYEIGLPDEYTDFYFDLGTDAEGNTVNTLELSPNQTYVLDPKVYPTTEWTQLLNYVSDDESVARVVNNTLVAVAPGKTTIRAQQLADKNLPTDPDVVLKEATFELTVHAEYIESAGGGYVYDSESNKYIALTDKNKAEYEGATTYAKNPSFKKISKPVVDKFYVNGYYVNKAFYFLSSTDRDIGETGNEMKFNGENYVLEMFPSEAVTIRYILDAYFPDATEVEFKSSNSKIVSVDNTGKITANAEGYASVTIKVLQDGKSTYYSKTITITVKDPYVTTGPMLSNYYGNGGHVTIPEDLDITEIGQFAFSNYIYVEKEEWEKDPDTNEDYKLWYLGENTITSVIIPEGVEKIGAYAFANLSALEEVVLPSTLKMIDQGAFYGCTKLKKVQGIENVKFINQNAFANCSIEGELKLDNAVAIGNYAFANNGKKYEWVSNTERELVSSGLTSIVLSEKTQSIGSGAFGSCDSVESITIKAEMVQLSMQAFAYCSSLKSITINAPVIPTGAFDGCTKLESVTLGKDVKQIGEYAFSNTALKSFTVAQGNESFKVVEGKPYLLNMEGDTIVLFASGVKGKVTISDSNIKTVGRGAFAGCVGLISVSIPSATEVKDFGFAGCNMLSEITLGELTEIGSYAFRGTAVKQAHKLDKVSYIGDYAYAESQVQMVQIPSGITVGVSAFQDCTKLMYVSVGDNVVIKNDAFRFNNANNCGVASRDEDGKTVYYYSYFSPAGTPPAEQYGTQLKTILIGKNVTIGDAAFYGAAQATSITIGEGAIIGEYAFYNTESLKTIDLSGVKKIGAYAFSGDVLYTYLDNPSTSPEPRIRADKNGNYIYDYHSPVFTEINLTGIMGDGENGAGGSVGTNAFSFCLKLEKVVLGDNITVIESRAFGDCTALKDINLSKIATIETEAFAKTALESIDLSSVETIGSYAFVYCEELESVKLNDAGVVLSEGAFAYCNDLTAIDLSKVTSIGAYAFAYAGITNLDLSSATFIGDLAFMKENVTAVTVKLSKELADIGENPFAMCTLKSFTETNKETFNGVSYDKESNTYSISDNVKIIDGNIYRVVPNGYELITFTGNTDSYKVVDETVRLSAFAFAGTGIKNVVLPRELVSIGHKAFYSCNDLQIVVFSTYDAPVLEEEYDYAYYASFMHFPATGEYSDFTDASGNAVIINGIGIVDYFMYNVATFPTNTYYGANFIDYVGYVDNKIIMSRPANGRNYDSFIFSQYFSVVIDGEDAPDKATLDAINAIKSLPAKDKITLDDEALVVAARNAYKQIASSTQQGIVIDEGYYDILIVAEKQISDLKYLKDKENNKEDDTTPPPVIEEEEEEKPSVVGIIILAVLTVVALAGYLVPVFLKVIKPRIMAKKQAKQNEAISSEAEPAQEAEVSTEPSADDTKDEVAGDASNEE